MRELLIDIFTNYSALVIFLHILGAIIWVGGMIAIRVAVHPSLATIEDGKLKLGKSLQIIGRLFNLVLPFIIIIIITATIMAVGMNFKESDLYWIIHLKEVIWTIMSINFGFMYFKRSRAQKFYNKGELAFAKEEIRLFANVLLPINIILGLVALFAGVTLRGF